MKPMTPQRIKDAAQTYAEKENSAYVNDYNGYIAGATALNERAQDLVDALEGIDNSPTPYNEREMKSWIETARALVSEALAKWKGEGEQLQVELSCMVCGTKFMGPEPQMCCSGRDCGCMGLPIDPIVCSKECYEKGLPRQKGDSGVAIN